MKNRLKYILLAPALIFFASCEDYLNVEPTLSISDETALSTEASIKKLLIGAYEIDALGFSHGGFVQLHSDLLGADNQVSWNGTFVEIRQPLTKELLADNIIVTLIWNNLYQGINQTNLVLSNLGVIADETERARVDGEARFLRALNYFELVRLFGSDTKGIPLRLEPVTDFAGDLSIARSSTSDVYTAIIDDLTTAILNLPDDNDVYADKYAAMALLSRIHLYRNEYQEARNLADNVIANSGKELANSFAEAFNLEEDGPEDLYAIQITSQSGQNLLVHMYASEGNGGRGGDISINQEYVDLFDDPNDERSLFFYENDKGDRLSGKFTNQFANVPMIRLAEMILIRAETNFRLGTSVGATPLDDINALRQRSGAAPLSTLTLEDILLERQRELAFEGFGIYDVKRTGATVQGLPSDSPRLIMPIPTAEMDTNPLMEQNEGY